MLQSVISFVLAHEAVLAGAVVAILDLLFAINPKTESNGILHWISVQLRGIKAPPAPPAA